jgi:glycosyltransferase involved in cell wall biosynthesis
MRIACLIDSLNSGGAQRQMCMLAPLLKKRGMEVEVLTYFPHDFFAHLLKEAGVPWRVITWRNHFGRIFAVRKAIRDAKPDVVIAYLETPSLMAELAAIPDRPFKLIVSERNTTLSPGFKDKVYYNLHRLADAVVPNSYSQQRVLEKYAPYLKNKINTIINCVDLDKYKPTPAESLCSDPIKILVLGRLEPQKNPMGLAQAVAIVAKKRPEIKLQIHWYGRQPRGENAKLFVSLKKQIEQESLQSSFLLYNPVQNVIPLYHQSDAVCMPSFYEGCSNVIAEAIACGKPVLAGNVCDNPILVNDGRNGLLFDSKNPEDIAEKLIQFSEMSVENRNQMARESRKMAEELLSPDRFVKNYINVIQKL